MLYQFSITTDNGILRCNIISPTMGVLYFRDSEACQLLYESRHHLRPTSDIMDALSNFLYY